MIEKLNQLENVYLFCFISPAKKKLFFHSQSIYVFFFIIFFCLKCTWLKLKKKPLSPILYRGVESEHNYWTQATFFGNVFCSSNSSSSILIINVKRSLQSILLTWQCFPSSSFHFVCFPNTNKMINKIKWNFNSLQPKLSLYFVMWWHPTTTPTYRLFLLRFFKIPFMSFVYVFNSYLFSQNLTFIKISTH